MEDVLNYIRLCRNALCEVIAAYDLKDFEAEIQSVEEKRQSIQAEIGERKSQLKTLLAQKVRDLTMAAGNEELVSDTYESIQKDLLVQIHGLELRLKELDATTLETPDVKDKLRSALDVVDKIIAVNLGRHVTFDLPGGGTGSGTAIDVDADGLPEITLKYGLSGLIRYNPADEMNRRENTMIAVVMKLIIEDERGYTSAKYLSEHMTALGLKKTKQSILPYIRLMKELGILKDTDNPLKPYEIVKPKAEIEPLIRDFLPDIRPEITAAQLSEQCLHSIATDRWHAGNGI